MYIDLYKLYAHYHGVIGVFDHGDIDIRQY